MHIFVYSESNVYACLGERFNCRFLVETIAGSPTAQWGWSKSPDDHLPSPNHLIRLLSLHLLRTNRVTKHDDKRTNPNCPWQTINGLADFVGIAQCRDEMFINALCMATMHTISCKVYNLHKPVCVLCCWFFARSVCVHDLLRQSCRRTILLLLELTPESNASFMASYEWPIHVQHRHTHTHTRYA